MFLFQNQTITNPDDVQERNKYEYRIYGEEAETRLRNFVDDASRSSFPASDPPSGSLTCIGPPARPAEASVDEMKGANNSASPVL
jgi:hypothetical protein